MNTGARFAIVAALSLAVLAPGCRLARGVTGLIRATSKAKTDAEPAAGADTGTRMEMVRTTSGLRTVYLVPAAGGDGSMVEACGKARGSESEDATLTVGGIATVMPTERTVYPEPNCEASSKPQTARVITGGEAKLVFSDAESGCSGSNRIPADKAAQIADGLELGEVVTWQTSAADEIQPYAECVMRHFAIAVGVQNAKCVVKDRQPCTIQLERRGMVKTCKGSLEVTCTSN